jgi:mRNA interferase MazF
MVILRGSVWWAELPEPDGSAAGYRRPVVVVQDNLLNRSRINTLIVAPLTSNLKWANLPGNVEVPADMSGLSKTSVINLSLIFSIDKRFLENQIGQLPPQIVRHLDNGLRLVLSL